MAAAAAPARALGGKLARTVEVGATVKAARRQVPRVGFRSNRGSQRPVITTMTVTLGLGFLHAWLVEKKAMPDRAFLVRLAILGFGLSLLTELTPKFGKGMSYLVLTGVVFDRSQDILRELQKEPKGTGVTGGTDLEPSPLTPKATPVVLYTRSGPMTTDPQLPNRPRIKRPQAGAWAQT